MAVVAAASDSDSSEVNFGSASMCVPETADSEYTRVTANQLRSVSDVETATCQYHLHLTCPPFPSLSLEYALVVCHRGPDLLQPPVTCSFYMPLLYASD